MEDKHKTRLGKDDHLLHFNSLIECVTVLPITFTSNYTTLILL